LRFVRSGDIKTVKIPKEMKGENEAISIMKKHGCDFIVSDDIKFVIKVKRKHKNVHFSVFLVSVLHELGEITKEETWEAVNKIFEKREWSENLIYSFAKELLG